MKTLSGTFAFVALAVIAIVTLPSCCRKQVSKAEDKLIYLEFGKEGTKAKTPVYVELKENMHDEFFKALCDLKAHEGVCDVKYKADANPHTPEIDACDRPCPPKSIKTDKITTSEVARIGSAEESAAYDPHAVYRVQSNSAKDIKEVLKTFKD